MQTKTKTTKTITLTYEPNAQYWLMDTKGPPNYPTLEVPMNHEGQFTFKIVNTPGVTFANPAFVQKKGKPDPGDFGAQFTAEVKPNGKTLVVTDANTSPNSQPQKKDYHYELNFSNEVPLDPIITNMGCCQRAEADYLMPLAIGAAALLAIYFFVVRPWLVRRTAQGRAPTNQDHMDR